VSDTLINSFGLFPDIKRQTISI